MLKSFLASLPDDSTRREWAASCGTSLGHLRNCIYQPKPVSPETCVLIEQKSAGQVRRWHLRPGDWHRIWPELICLPGAPIVGDCHQKVNDDSGQREQTTLGRAMASPGERTAAPAKEGARDAA